VQQNSSFKHSSKFRSYIITTALRYWRKPTKDHTVNVLINHVVHKINKDFLYSIRIFLATGKDDSQITECLRFLISAKSINGLWITQKISGKVISKGTFHLKVKIARKFSVEVSSIEIQQCWRNWFRQTGIPFVSVRKLGALIYLYVLNLELSFYIRWELIRSSFNITCKMVYELHWKVH
jgi:hypothetical protein